MSMTSAATTAVARARPGVLRRLTKTLLFVGPTSSRIIRARKRQPVHEREDGRTDEHTGGQAIGCIRVSHFCRCAAPLEREIEFDCNDWRHCIVLNAAELAARERIGVRVVECY